MHIFLDLAANCTAVLADKNQPSAYYKKDPKNIVT